MNLTRIPPAWRLPDGVDAPLWQYTHTPRLAADEDAYFEGHALFQADEQILDERFTVPGRLVDLGCGAGRHSIRFASRGFSVTAVDLSHSMLQRRRPEGRESWGRALASAGESLPARMRSGPELRLRHFDVQHRWA